MSQSVINQRTASGAVPDRRMAAGRHAAEQPSGQLATALRRNMDLFTNSGSLMGTTILTSGLGFVYWWVAARAFPAEAVGSASAAVSVLSLLGTIGMFGMGTLLISELPRMSTGHWQLINACLVVSGSVATLGGLVYVALAEFLFTGLRAALGSPVSIALILFGIALNAATLVLDEGLIGLLSGPLQLWRNGYFAVSKLLLLAALALLPISVTGSEILATWLLGIMISVGLLALSLRARGMRALTRPRLSALRGLARLAFDHNLLNMALLLPRSAMPLVVTAVLSTRATASFYAAWQVLAILSMVPVSLATTLFAVGRGDPVALRQKTRAALAAAIGLGLPASLVTAVLAHPIMASFGSEYAASASGVLAILSLAQLGTISRQLFIAVSRVQDRVRGATVISVAAGVVELVVAWYGARRGGLSGLAIWLAVVLIVEGVLMAPTVLRVAFGRATGGSATNMPSYAGTGGRR